MESLYSELVSTGIAKKCPPVEMRDYIGMYSFGGTASGKSDAISYSSMAQLRQILNQYCVLPLGCPYIHSKVQHIKTILLYGHSLTGKTLLSQAITHSCGANFFDLSPRITDGKYPGKQVSMMLHIVFKVAKAMAPSVIYIDEAEKVFLTDKKKLKEFGGTEPFNRIKKDLIKEVKALVPGDRVLVIGNSSEPYLCAKKDEKAFMSFWIKQLHTPIPDSISRMALWMEAFAKYSCPLPYGFDTSTLAYLSEGVTSGAITKVARTLLSPDRIASLRQNPITLAEILDCMSLFQRISSEEKELMQSWTEKLNARNAVSKSQENPEIQAPTKKK